MGGAADGERFVRTGSENIWGCEGKKGSKEAGDVEPGLRLQISQ